MQACLPQTDCRPCRPRSIQSWQHIKPKVCRAVSRSSSPKERLCTLYDFSGQLIPYEEAWRWQKAYVEQVLTQLSGNTNTTRQPESDSLDAILLLQHPAVFTLGSGSTLDNLRFEADNAPAPLFRTERGGEVTVHCPGQLVAYPIFDLRHYQQDLHWYMRSLEEVIIRCLHEVAGIQGKRVPGMTGVWVGSEKIAAIGVRVTRWVTYHGLALNVTNDLSMFDQIVPCGIQGKGVTSLKSVLAGTTSGSNHKPNGLHDAYGSDSDLILECSAALASAMMSVFDMTIETSPVDDWARMKYLTL